MIREQPRVQRAGWRRRCRVRGRRPRRVPGRVRHDRARLAQDADARGHVPRPQRELPEARRPGRTPPGSSRSAAEPSRRMSCAIADDRREARAAGGRASSSRSYGKPVATSARSMSGAVVQRIGAPSRNAPPPGRGREQLAGGGVEDGAGDRHARRAGTRPRPSSTGSRARTTSCRRAGRSPTPRRRRARPARDARQLVAPPAPRRRSAASRQPRADRVARPRRRSRRRPR